MKSVALVAAGCVLGLSGCATRLQTAEDQKPIVVGAAASKKIVVDFDGGKVATDADSWSSLKETWQEGCTEEAKNAGVALSFQDGSPHSTGEDGTLVAIYVNDFHYVSTGARIGLGIMTGNAFIDAKARFMDLKNGAVWGERPYSTASSAWQGVFSAMTPKQTQTICKEMLAVVGGK
ncbi:MAG TPA: hypothetical protein VGN07_05580 [Steroidobacteraceae bacterium]